MPTPDPVTFVLCHGCGYDLRGIDSERCPECGRARDRSSPAASYVPWEHRRRVGRVRAYCQTVRLALTRPDQLARNVAGRPADLRAARSFRRVTLLAAFLPVAAALLRLYAASLTSEQTLEVRRPSAADPQSFVSYFEVELAADVTQAWRGPAPLGWAAEFAVLAAALAGVWLFLAAATSLAGCFFCCRGLPPAQQDAAYAAGAYACAPVALFPWLVVALWGLVWLESRATGRAAPWSIMSEAPGPASVAAAVLIEIAAVLVFTAYFITTLSMLRAATRCGPARLAAAALALPIGWAGLAALVLAGVPLAAAFVALVVLSLRG